MNVVLVHLGPKPLPPYTWTAAGQVRRHFAGSLYLIAPQADFDRDRIAEHGIEFVAAEEFANYERNREYERVTFLDYDREHWQGFWSVTLQRFMYIEAWMAATKVRDVLHIENDVLIYSNPLEILPIWQRLYPKRMVVTDGADYHSSGAYCYIPEAEAVGVLNQRFIEYLQKGEDGCRKEQGYESIVSEMTLLSAIRRQYPEDLGVMPILPAGRGSDNIREFGSLFDSMSWGQWVCGCHQNPGVPFSADIHWVGKAIRDDVYDVAWSANRSGDRVPWVYHKMTNRGWRLNNLHVHSKELEKWV